MSMPKCYDLLIFVEIFCEFQLFLHTKTISKEGVIWVVVVQVVPASPFSTRFVHISKINVQNILKMCEPNKKLHGYDGQTK